MDFLRTLSSEFPELTILIRTHQLPYRLATSPIGLVSWLILMRRIGIHLDRFPHVLPECFESADAGFAIATFMDGGPPMIGDISYVSDYVERPVTECDCGSSSYCDYTGELHGSLVPVRHFLEATAPFKPPIPLGLNWPLRHLSSIGKLVLEFPDTGNTPPLRYVPEWHGRVLVAKEDDEIKSTHGDTEESPDPEGSLGSEVSHLSVIEFLASEGESTTSDDDIGPSIFSDDFEEKTMYSEITSDPLDNASEVEVSWKRRPIDLGR